MNREVRLFDEIDRFARGGEISHAIALTFGYDGDAAAERIWTPLIEKYGVRHPLVIASGIVEEGTALGVHVLRAPKASGVFHPKLFLAVREDAVFAAIGSANLTRGGLGANLEMLTPIVFARDEESAPPRAVLRDILTFLGTIVDGLASHAAAHSIGKVREVIRAAHIVLDGLPEPRRSSDLRFVHSYDKPLWEQLVEAHGNDVVTHVAVVSPFFEKDDPALEEGDSLLLYALGEGLPWAQRAKAPRCSLHVVAVGDGSDLPRAALESSGSVVALFVQALSEEPRRLHAKLIAVFGKKRTTLLWGSPNFTPAALLRSAHEGGNVECGLAMTTSAAQVSPEALSGELDLNKLFHLHDGPLPEARMPPRRQRPIFEVGEALYDGETRVLSIFGEVWSQKVARMVVLVDLGANKLTLAEAPLKGPGPLHIEALAGQLEEMDPETGRRRLRSLNVSYVAFDADGQAIAEQRARINVRFEDALELRGNLLLGAEALSADALLVPSAAPPEARVAALDRMISLWKAARHGEQTMITRHQASLDGFFRNVRGGLDARWEGLQRRRGSCFSLMRWSHDLRRALLAATKDETMDPVRRAYLVARVASHITRVLAAIPGWHNDPERAFSVLDAGELTTALDAVSLSNSVRPEITMDARAARDRGLAVLASAGKSGRKVRG